MMDKEEYRERFVETVVNTVDELELKGEMRDNFIQTAIYFYDLGVSDCEKSQRIDWERVILIAMIAVIVISLLIKLFV